MKKLFFANFSDYLQIEVVDRHVVIFCAIWYHLHNLTNCTTCTNLALRIGSFNGTKSYKNVFFRLEYRLTSMENQLNFLDLTFNRKSKHVMFCAIWNLLYNLKNAHGICNFTKSNTYPQVFLTNCTDGTKSRKTFHMLTDTFCFNDSFWILGILTPYYTIC